MDDVYDYLCWYDPRYSSFTPLDPACGDQPEPRKGCGCDNCFYGRDALALRLLAMREDREAADAMFSALAAARDAMLARAEQAERERDEAVAALKRDGAKGRPR